LLSNDFLNFFSVTISLFVMSNAQCHQCTDAGNVVAGS
jgi:hypothetical protein